MAAVSVWVPVTRRYSRDDLDRVSDITSLLGDGLNLAGIGQVLQLREETRRLAAQVGELQAAGEPRRHEIRRLRRENRALQAELDQRDNPDPASTSRSPTVAPLATGTGRHERRQERRGMRWELPRVVRGRLQSPTRPVS
jgi:DNA-binding transcriptional MerR regulator